MNTQKFSGRLSNELFSSGAVAVMERAMDFDVLTSQFAMGPNHPTVQSLSCSNYCSMNCNSKIFTRCC
jgi:hypothetical protein